MKRSHIEITFETQQKYNEEKKEESGHVVGGRVRALGGHGTDARPTDACDRCLGEEGQSGTFGRWRERRWGWDR